MATILLILIIILSLRLFFQWIVPLVLPYMLKRFIKRNGQNFDTSNSPFGNKTETPPPFSKPNTSAKAKEDEYIDFEEV